MYLSAEQRLNYLIKIDLDGKIRWARNDQYVDTAAGIWTDAGEGKGIIKADDQQAFRMRPKQEGHTNAAVLSSSSKGQDSPDEEMVAKHYHGPSANKDLNFFQKIWKDSFTTHGIMDRLLRKTVKKNTWLYVAVSVLVM